jgi:hypothetical protein
MSRNADTARAYTGRSGQLAVVAELLARHCNAAVPEVDVGTDVFAFNDERDDVARVQVKTARGVRYADGSGFSAQFSVPLKQLERLDSPPLFYTFVVRLDDDYVEYLIIERLRLQNYWHVERRFGSKDNQGNLVLKVQFRDKIICGEVDLSNHRNDWHVLPPLVLEASADSTGTKTESANTGEKKTQNDSESKRESNSPGQT